MIYHWGKPSIHKYGDFVCYFWCTSFHIIIKLFPLICQQFAHYFCVQTKIFKYHMVRSCYEYRYILHANSKVKGWERGGRGIVLGTLLKVPVWDKPHHSCCMRLSVLIAESMSEDRTTGVVQGRAAEVWVYMSTVPELATVYSKPCYCKIHKVAFFIKIGCSSWI